MGPAIVVIMDSKLGPLENQKPTGFDDATSMARLTIIKIEYIHELEKKDGIHSDYTEIVENGWDISNSPTYVEIAWRISPVSSSGASHETSPSLQCRFGDGSFPRLETIPIT